MTEEEYKSYPVRIKVVSQKGWCGMCHQVDDEWLYKFEPGKVPDVPNICPEAFHSLFIYIKPLLWGAVIPFPTQDPDTFLVTCPDAGNPVVFELKRLKDQPMNHRYGGKYQQELGGYNT